MFVVVDFDALAQASDFRIERRQVVFLCRMQDWKLGSLRHQFASRLPHSQTDWAIDDTHTHTTTHMHTHTYTHTYGRDLYLVKPTLGLPKEFPAPDKSWRNCCNPTPTWPHQGHKVPYLVPRTTDNLLALWPDSGYRTHASGVYSVTTKS